MEPRTGKQGAWSEEHGAGRGKFLALCSCAYRLAPSVWRLPLSPLLPALLLHAPCFFLYTQLPASRQRLQQTNHNAFQVVRLFHLRRPIETGVFIHLLRTVHQSEDLKNISSTSRAYSK